MNNGSDPKKRKQIFDRKYGDGYRRRLLLRKYTLQLELVPLLVSVTAVVATGVTMHDAIGVQILDTQCCASEQDARGIQARLWKNNDLEGQYG